MRVTRQTLLKIADDTVAQRVQTNRNILAVYLTGSVAKEVDPLLGGTADIDLVFLHEYDHPKQREIIRLTEDIHLDILHHTRQDYNQVRELRVHPQMGPVIYGCQILHDPRHFLDFAQASVRAHFFRADNVLQRAQTQLAAARQVWFSFQFYDAQPGVSEVHHFLKAVADATRAVATIEGRILSERRFLGEFFDCVNQLEKPGLFAGLLGLLGANTISAGDLQLWISEWELLYSAIGEIPNFPPSFHPFRLNYYKKAYQALLESDRPIDVAWPMLLTGLDMLDRHPELQTNYPVWQTILTQVGLWGANFQDRIQALDTYLDSIDETLENWGEKQGI